MKNKLGAALIAAVIAVTAAVTVFAADDADVILAGYDADGRLVGAMCVKESEIAASVTAGISGAVSYRMGTPGKDGFTDVEMPVTTAEPAASAVPSASASPSATAAAARATYPSIYEKEKDAVFTLSVVESVASVSVDGQDMYSVTAYTRGERETLSIPSDTVIAVASDFFADLKGSDASVLQKGDIVYFEKSPNGSRYRAMAFIYRPLDDDIMTTDGSYGTSFERLISSNGAVYAADKAGAVLSYGKKDTSSSRYKYAFGLLADKTSAEFTLYNKSGLYSDSIDVEYEADTIVYTVDMSSKKDITVGNGHSIAKSFIAGSSYDDDDNIVSFNTDDVYNYAFARIVDGTATEVVLYTNYND